MPPRSISATLPLPRGWRNITRVGVLHAISVVAMAMNSAWSSPTREACVFVSARRPEKSVQPLRKRRSVTGVSPRGRFSSASA